MPHKIRKVISELPPVRAAQFEQQHSDVAPARVRLRRTSEQVGNIVTSLSAAMMRKDTVAGWVALLWINGQEAPKRSLLEIANLHSEDLSTATAVLVDTRGKPSKAARSLGIHRMQSLVFIYHLVVKAEFRRGRTGSKALRMVTGALGNTFDSVVIARCDDTAADSKWYSRLYERQGFQRIPNTSYLVYARPQ